MGSLSSAGGRFIGVERDGRIHGSGNGLPRSAHREEGEEPLVSVASDLVRGSRSGEGARRRSLPYLADLGGGDGERRGESVAGGQRRWQQREVVEEEEHHLGEAALGG